MSERLQKMKELATVESKKLKKFATKEELSRLDFELLDPDNRYRCVYGLMTGHCYSDRAQELIIKSCTRVYKSNLEEDGEPCISDARLNGKPWKTESRRVSYHSPIETLILNDTPLRTYQKKIVDFLKGETETLSL